MLRLVKIDLKRGLLSWSFLFALIIGLMASFYGTLSSISLSEVDVISLFTKASGDTSTAIYAILTYILIFDSC